MAEIQARHPHATLELWAFDEHRLGLRPILRRQWGPKGWPRIARVRQKYEWTWLYGFVHPQSGRSFYLVAPSVNFAWCNWALSQFALETGAGANKRVVLVLDGAGWHRGGGLVVPEGIELVFLPSYSPELQPAERLWPVADEAVANRHFETIGQLEDALEQRCRVMMNRLEGLIQGLTLFHWWPRLRPSHV